MNKQKYRKAKWPKSWIQWEVNGTTFISVPFTWLLPKLKSHLKTSYKFSPVVVGGPAVKAMPSFLSGISGVTVDTGDIKGVLQRFEPLATKTTYGCIRKCKFCLVRKTEGKFTELDEWPNLPIVCDNNILASSGSHFQKVINGLVDEWGWADFNGGIDVRILTKYHARQFARIKKAVLRIALDDNSYIDKWISAVKLLTDLGVKRSNIRSYALIGFNSDPQEAWARCMFIEKSGIMPIPMWFRRSDAMYKNKITEEQKELGWSEQERLRIMSWFYNRTILGSGHTKKSNMYIKKSFFSKIKKETNLNG
ncbi:hypothetical protein A2619_02345 [candidate division WWE3 bacterium RIFOXYD1_FULL_39_9]|uniref:Radical SAM core domain-containing protein n=1 Tax=candidate division WWE3 bacterium RIFOXYD1_FULL_39_9 TaxID=1802649 RepID=A0A1F4X3Y8_UNCKA|nr:MAG: hypothetical protein A2619_02345 [candidate division WWE3 bacterium RIFOXYD1_FULL_39_9]